LAEFLEEEDMENKLSNALDIYNNIKQVYITEQSKQKPASNFSSSPVSESVVSRGIEIFQFTGYSIVDENKKMLKNKGNITSIQTEESYAEVPIMTQSAGHLKGFYVTYKPNDLVLVGWLDKTSPIILGGINDDYTLSKDIVPLLKEAEALISPKTAGSYLIIKDDDSIKLNNTLGGNVVIDATGTTVTTPTGAKMKINLDGSFKLYTKDNYGIESDASGNITIRGVTINHTQTVGTWP
jgi:hypothetical protein